LKLIPKIRYKILQVTFNITTMTTTNMLEHQKIILMNSVHDKNMFRKELMKSIKWLDQIEQQKLYLWLKEKFWNIYRDLIESIFNLETA
jgi:hypothetical protein